MNSNVSNCSSSFLKSREFLQALAPWERYLVIACGILCVSALIILIENIVFISRHYGNSRTKVTSIWLVGLPPVLSVTSLLAMIAPNVFVFRDVLMSICLSVVMYKFLQLLIVYGKSFQPIREQILSHRRLQFNVQPLCCLCFCLPSLPLTSTNFRVMKAMVLQYPILVILITVIIMVTWLDGVYITGKWVTDTPYPYLSTVRVCSVVLAIFALNVFVKLSEQAMRSLHVRQKHVALSASMFLFSVQGFTFDILATNNVFHSKGCYSGSVMSNFYENVTYCIQMFFVTLLNVWSYRRPLPADDHTNNNNTGAITLHTDDSKIQTNIDNNPPTQRADDQRAATRSDQTVSDRLDHLSSITVHL
ncbi:organic solute transporter subunit alpha-like [Physella acuta]|uniref:organic solute transporter subunit alpha-like n=1 Tax=Physella acuta TaxID=109671 RepID=UPI0027DE5294|nr:organic solute transporter subunit alpha-like [Physella acuta]